MALIFNNMLFSTHLALGAAISVLLRLNGHLVSTYESASTRRFKLGRVDNIRAASSEALSWCQAMQDDAQTTETRLDLLKKAMVSQTEYMVQVMGNCWRDKFTKKMHISASEAKEYITNRNLWQND